MHHTRPSTTKQETEKRERGERERKERTRVPLRHQTTSNAHTKTEHPMSEATRKLHALSPSFPLKRPNAHIALNIGTLHHYAQTCYCTTQKRGTCASALHPVPAAWLIPTLSTWRLRVNIVGDANTPASQRRQGEKRPKRNAKPRQPDAKKTGEREREET